MDKGYLFILIGAIFSARLFINLPSELMFWWSRLTFFGYIMISAGLRLISGTDEELRRAQLFNFITLITQVVLSWGFGRGGVLGLAINILHAFSSLCIFFWLLKSEYMWSPSLSKKTDLTMYSVIAVIFLALRVVLMLPIFSIISPSLLLSLVDILRFVNILYYGILIFILVKLYNATRRFPWS